MSISNIPQKNRDYRRYRGVCFKEHAPLDINEQGEITLRLRLLRVERHQDEDGHEIPHCQPTHVCIDEFEIPFMKEQMVPKFSESEDGQKKTIKLTVREYLDRNRVLERIKKNYNRFRDLNNSISFFSSIPYYEKRAENLSNSDLTGYAISYLNRVFNIYPITHGYVGLYYDRYPFPVSYKRYERYRTNRGLVPYYFNDQLEYVYRSWLFDGYDIQRYSGGITPDDFPQKERFILSFEVVDEEFLNIEWSKTFSQFIKEIIFNQANWIIDQSQFDVLKQFLPEDASAQNWDFIDGENCIQLISDQHRNRRWLV